MQMTRFLSLLVFVVAIMGLTANSSASVIVYTAHLDGTSESPSNASPGTGFAEVDFDIAAHSMRVQVTFSDLLGTTTASHIHAPTSAPGVGNAGVATTTPTFAGFPLGVTSGTYDHILDMTLASSYNPSFVTVNGGTTAGAEAALVAALADGKAYLNIHTTMFPGGEIRGFLAPVPEPSTLLIWSLLGTVAIGVGRWRLRKAA
jgi:hypothetical protein